MNLDNEWNNWRKRLKEKFKEHPLEIIQWEATRRCDMNCRHCGSPREVDHSGELTTEEAISAFSQIRTEFNLDEFKFLTITGGEPFLRKDLFEILKAVYSFGWISTIHTDGNYLAKYPEKIQELIEIGVKGIGIDLDGTRYYHDSLRRKTGHYEQSVQVIKNLVEFSNLLHLIVTTVITKDNITELDNLWSEIKKLNPHRWRLLPLEGIGRSNESRLVLDVDDYLYLLNFIREKRIENVNQQCVQVEIGCMGWLGRDWEGWIRPYIWSCIAGKTVLGILYDGSLSACAHIDRAFIQGNVRTNNIKDIWQNSYEVFRNPPKQKVCDSCTEVDFCTPPMHKLNNCGIIRECIFQKINKRRQHGRKE